MLEETFVVIEEKYGRGVVLDEYKGDISICSAQKGKKDDKLYLQWMYPQGSERKPIEKSLPWKLTIGGSTEQAISTLEGFIVALKGDVTSAPEHEETQPDTEKTDASDSDDVPF